MIMKILFCILYALAVAIHIFSCVPPMKKWLRRPTKVMLMPLLALSYAFLAQSVNPLILVALLFSCIGDTLLLFPDKGKFFKLGISAFGVCHLMYIIFFLTHIAGATPLWLIIAAIVLYAAAIGLMLYALSPRLPQDMLFPYAAYIVIIALMSLSALMYASAEGAASKLVFAGSIFFLISDSFLSFTTFKKSFRAATLTVMATYILAQSLIVFGIVGGGV